MTDSNAICEGKGITKEEIGCIENKINALEDTQIRLKNKTFSVKHVIMLATVDAKVYNAAILAKISREMLHL